MLTNFKKRYLQRKLNTFKALRNTRGYLTSSELSVMLTVRDELYLLLYGG